MLAGELPVVVAAGVQWNMSIRYVMTDLRRQLTDACTIF
jgi:hypothetical protein